MSVADIPVSLSWIKIEKALNMLNGFSRDNGIFNYQYVHVIFKYQYVHGDLCKHVGIDSSTDHPDRYSNLFLNAYINHHVHAEYL